jgi:hypothetical protein
VQISYPGDLEQQMLEYSAFTRQDSVADAAGKTA